MTAPGFVPRAATDPADIVAELRKQVRDLQKRFTPRIQPYKATNFPTGTTDYSASPATLATITVPDPGFPYLLQVCGQAEAGSTASGTRWDIWGRLDSPTGTTITAPGVNGEAVSVIRTGLGYTGVLTGSHTVYLVLVQAYGSANGRCTASNAGMSVVVFPQL